MFYKYDHRQLIFRRLSLKTYLKAVLFLSVVLTISHIATYYYAINVKFDKLSDTEKALIISGKDEFSQEKLIQMMKDLNVKYPWIPIAQSMLETGHWKSDMFLENNNLFGMKEAKQRVTTAQGTQSGHAYYESWRESVYDYAFYQARYLNKIKSEREYFEYLSASYAEDPTYVEKIKSMISKHDLKSCFK